MTIKVSLIGKGKTGGQLLELLQEDSIHSVFDSSTPLDIKKINQSDVGIIFIPGKAFVSLLPRLIHTSIPLIIGATGFTWPPDFLDLLAEKKKKWVHGHNFSLGMHVIRHLLGLMGKSQKILQDMNFHIHEVHHRHKVDAPSGTALKWKEWLGVPQVEMSYDRQGDVIGLHELTLSGPMEKLQLRHEALDRKLFAHGALWAAQKAHGDSSFPYGLTLFENLVDDSLQGSFK